MSTQYKHRLLIEVRVDVPERYRTFLKPYEAVGGEETTVRFYYTNKGDKEFFTSTGPRTESIRSVGQRHEGLNQRIERLIGEIRDREIVMRGMDNDETAQGQEGLSP